MRQWFLSWPSLIILIILTFFLARGVWGVYVQERDTRITKNQRVAHLEELEGRESALQEELDRLDTERGVEEEIRRKFEVAREGEKVIVIVDAPTNAGEDSGGNPKGFWRSFFDTVVFWD